MPLTRLAALAAAAVVIGVLENSLFGSDAAGTARHLVSVGFFFLAVLGIVALVVIGVLALVRRGRATT